MGLARPVALGSGQSEHRSATRQRSVGAVLIRDAREADLDRAARVMVAAYREYEPLLHPDAWQVYATDIAAVRSRFDSSRLIVCERDGRLDGAVTFYPPGGFPLVPPAWACFRLLAVAPDARGRGVGRALVDGAIRRAKATGAEALAIHNAAFMEVALKLYERIGFTPEPQFDFRWPEAGRDGSPLTVNAYRLPLGDAS